jgi:nuclear pore complex protein Nup205
MTEAADNSPSLYNVNLVREWLNAYKADVLHRQIEAPGAKQVDEEDLISEADGILATIEARNRSIIALSARKEALREYIEMVIAIIECCPMDATEKLQFIQRILQIMLPKLDALIAEESDDVTELARAAEALLLSLAETPRTYTHLDNLVTERLFQLFRASIEGIPMSNTSTMLRGTLYSICLHYLGRIMSSATDSDSNINSKARRNSMDCVRSASQRLIQILCDDAEDGLDTCRLNAINLLALLTSLARTEKSPFVLNSFIKANVLEILIEPLKHVAEEFQITEPASKFFIQSSSEMLT